MRYLIRFLFVALLAVVLLSPALRATSQTQIVYRQGSVEVAVPASQYINVFVAGTSTAKVFQQTGGPTQNTPTRFTLITSPSGRVTSGETSFGPFTTATTVRIEASTDLVYYSVGALGAVLPVLQPLARPAYTQLAPATYNTTSTLLASDLEGGIITSTQTLGSTVTLTLPTGTLTDAASGLQINQGWEWSLINLSTTASSTVTLAAGTGHTIVGDKILQIAAQTTGCATARFMTVKTAANTFITYRVQ